MWVYISYTDFWTLIQLANIWVPALHQTWSVFWSYLVKEGEHGAGEGCSEMLRKSVSRGIMQVAQVILNFLVITWKKTQKSKSNFNFIYIV